MHVTSMPARSVFSPPGMRQRFFRRSHNNNHVVVPIGDSPLGRHSLTALFFARTYSTGTWRVHGVHGERYP
jgi:hypothetical protein